MLTIYTPSKREYHLSAKDQARPDQGLIFAASRHAAGVYSVQLPSSWVPSYKFRFRPGPGNERRWYGMLRLTRKVRRRLG